MADRKITALSELTAPVATDVFPVVDVSEADNANKNKKITIAMSQGQGTSFGYGGGVKGRVLPGGRFSKRR